MSSDTSPTRIDHRELRRAKRAARRAVRGAARRAAQASIVAGIRATRIYRTATRIGSFIAFDGEPDLAPLHVEDSSKQFFVPVVGEHSIRFAAFEPGAETLGNRFGIPEPRRRRYAPALTLDLVLTPLVAFDDRGVRLGVGRGYYDRCFASLRGRRHWFRPRLVGVAFECQRAEFITPNPWDVPLWGVVTELGFRIFQRE